MWADDVTVTINDQTELATINNAATSEATATHKYGVYSGSDAADNPPYTTFTTIGESGCAGLTVTVSGKIMKPTYVPSSNTNYQHVISLFSTYEQTNANAYTMTIAAPSGYYIKSYTLKAISTGSAGKFYIAPAGESNTEVSSTLKAFTRTVCASTATLTMKRYDNNKTTELCIPQFSVVLAPIPTYDGSYAPLSINNTTGPSVAQWGSSWTSTSTPAGLQLTCTANNMEISTTANLHSAGGQTYTLTAPVGYLIGGYTIGMYGGAAGSFITPSGCGATLVGTDSSNPTYVYVTGLSAVSTTFTRTGTSTSGYATTFTVYLKPSYEVTYKLPGTSESDVVVEQFAGSSISAPAAWARDGVTFSYYTTYSDGVFSNPISTAPTNAQTVYVDYTFSKSSLISASSSELSWYRLAAYSNGLYYDLYYNGTAPYPFKAQSVFDGSDGYLWAFTGNPIDGFTIYNKAADGYTLYASGFGDGVAPYMDNENTSKWYMKINGSYIGFECAGTGNANRFWNDYGGGAASLRFYSGYTPLQYTHIDDVDFSVLYTNNIKPFIDNAGTGYFKISSSDAETLSGEYTTANSDSKITLSEYASLVSSLNSKISWPATGYYRVKSVSANKYMKAENVSQLTVDASGTGASSIVYLNGSNGTYTMKMQALNVYTNSNSSASTLTSSDKTTYLAIPVESSKLSPGKVTIGNGATATDFHCVSESNVQSIAIGTNTDDNTAAYWTFEEATTVAIPLNYVASAGGSFATMCLPFDVTLPSYGQTGFVVPCLVTIKGSRAQLVTSTKTQIPAGTPVLLYAPGEVASTTATIATSALSDPITGDNNLEGTYFNKTTLESNEYVFGLNTEDELGFWKLGDGFKVGANKAYLIYDGVASSVKGFAIDFNDADGISSMDNEQWTMDNAAIYNIAGQRVAKAQKGLYIVNGKKVVIK